MKEEWKDVIGFEGLYQVSSLGKLKSLSRDFIGKTGRKYKRNGCVRKCFHDAKRGYMKAFLYKNGQNYSMSIHRLVAMAFIHNPQLKPCINHKNGVHSDNRVENLEWVTYSENTVHSFKELGQKGGNFEKYGSLNSNSKKVNQFTLGMTFIKCWDSIIDAEKALKIKSSNIVACCKLKVKTAGSFKWEYA